MGNDGVHELDYARWGLGVETLPTKVSAMGTKLYFDDDQQYPDTMQVSFEYPGDDKVGDRRMLIFEMRIWSTSYPNNIDNGAEYYGTKGRLVLTKRGKLEVYDESNKVIISKRSQSGDAVQRHQRDFFQSIAEGTRPAADIEIGHQSAALCHLGNISARLGRALEVDPVAETIVDDDEAARMSRGKYREGHWAVPKGTA